MITDPKLLKRLDEIQRQIEDCEIEEPEMTPLDWAMYEFGTIEYDFQVHPEAARRIEGLFKQIYKDTQKET